MKNLPFSIRIQSGQPAYEQVVEAVHRAMAMGILVTGETFISVRDLAKSLGINPNTAHRVIQQLIKDGALEVLPGVGTRIAPVKKLSRERQLATIGEDAERLIVKAKRVGCDLNDVIDVIRNKWSGFQ